MVNLLPQKEARQLRSTYYERLFIVFCTVLSGGVAIGAALLIPPFVLAEQAVTEHERFAVSLEEAVGLRERSGVSEEVAVLAERVRALQEYAKPYHGIDVLKTIVGTRPKGVFITGIAFAGDETVTVSVAGRADNRAALLEYVAQLRQNPKLQNIAVPVSQLASESDISFSLSAVYIP